MSGHSHRPTLKQASRTDLCLSPPPFALTCYSPSSASLQTTTQKNKNFKSRHATKSSLKNAAKGKVDNASPATSSAASTHRAKAAAEKKNRMNHRAQIRSTHHKAIGQDSKFFSTVSGGKAVPRIVSVIPLHSAVRCEDFGKSFVEVLGMADEEKERVEKSLSDRGSWIMSAPKFKTSLQLVHLPPLSLYATLDAALASDYVILLLSSEHEVTEEGERILRCLQSVIGGGGGQAEVIACVHSPRRQPMSPQDRPGVLKSLLSFTNYFFPSVNKVHVVPTRPDASSSDANNLARSVLEGVPTGASSISIERGGAGIKGRGRDGRGWMVAETGDARQNGEDTQALRYELEGEGADRGTLSVTGTIRGARLSADRLVHIPGWGDYQLESIVASSVPRAAHRQHAKSMMTDDEAANGGILSAPTEQADDLTALNEVDTLGNEQTWPTEEEMAEGEAAMRDAERKPSRVKRVPKGTSAYQAAWILDDEDDNDVVEDGNVDDDDGVMQEDGDDLDEGDLGVEAGFGRSARVDEDDEEETEEVELDERPDEEEELDDAEEERQLQAFRKERNKEDAEDLHFPDEKDTPRNGLAQTRFQRYRGLKSFRTSPWDSYEDLPLDYAKIFQFEDYERTRRRAEEAGREEGVEVGTRVQLRIKDVPRALVEARDPRHPLVVYGLLQHEHKQSVLHFAVQRNTEYEAPVRAKDPLVLCVGPRRYRINPLYSQHTRGGGKGVNNVHKSERYLRHGTAVVATTYGPVVFGKQSCLLLRESEDLECPHLVAMGSFMSADPTRIIAKRIILTGHPFKVHRKTATVRYMFFNRDDIEYFAPIELHTKYGRTGHIKEPLGTHGYFKAIFDQPIQQMDTVCMSLYKRQYPKQVEYFTPPPAGKHVGEVEEVANEDDEMDIE